MTKTKKTKNFNVLKLKTALARVNLHGLMVRFSFARDCGSIPHGDSTKHVFQYPFFLKLTVYNSLIVKSIL